MTAGDREALDALARRLVHAEAIAAMLAREIGRGSDREAANALLGLSVALGDLSARVDLILDKAPA